MSNKTKVTVYIIGVIVIIISMITINEINRKRDLVAVDNEITMVSTENAIITAETTTEVTTIDTLKIEVANTYSNIWNMVDKSSDIYGESVSAITNKNLSDEEVIKITNDNDELAGQYLTEISKYLSPPTYDDNYAFAAYDYLSLIRTITLSCYSYAQTKDKYYVTQAEIAIDDIMDKFGAVMNEQREMPERAGYTLAEILVTIDDMEN